jgi:hypothetical protein
MISEDRFPPRVLQAMKVTLACNGSSKEAAYKMGITRNTLRNLRTQAYQIADVTCAIEFWSEMGWISLPPDLNPAYSKYDWRHRHQ